MMTTLLLDDEHGERGRDEGRRRLQHFFRGSRVARHGLRRGRGIRRHSPTRGPNGKASNLHRNEIKAPADD